MGLETLEKSKFIIRRIVKIELLGHRG
jgi:hypothetical protein